ncbi:penicillin-binding protein 2 [Pedobacter frigiditerrae]|uniref:Penicillin-binding protein 2 n=1 Tax=Pedobacter frigiditerrae TaxID=2530452 RepID=A0A4R0MKB7_9SPHI|nr:penicillin-binding protein 2 [Pedobacter frigiditerrae]TCC87058.1 penicillin-binding protein 2 [Pedobacter frigiditerrae]
MDQLFNRKYIIQGLFVLIALILLGKLFYMQVVSDKYFLSANNNALRKIYTYPARGVILDRNNKVLAQNQPTYDLLVTPNQVKPFDTLSLCRIIGIDTIEFRKKFDKAVAQSRFQESIFQKLISIETYATLQEKMFNFRGFSVRKRTIRFYPDSIAAQFLGYMREVTPTDLEKYLGYYKPGDYIGKGGIEKKYEIDLRGTKGVTHMLFNSKNVAQGSYNNGKMDSAAIAGEQLITTIDSRIQKLGEELLAHKVGSIVALEPSTGEVLAFVSSPGYDPNKLVGNNFSANYSEITANPNRPFVVRPIQGGYSPGSAFKPLDALIALSEGVVDPNTTFNCPGYYVAGNRRFKCEHVDGPIALRKGIARSCNTYFYTIFAKLMTKNGGAYAKQQSTYEDWQNKVRKFGIGDTLGIDFPGEKAYKLFRRADYDKLHRGRYWGNTTIMSVAIGQGEINTTPLQMANIMAIIANRGFYLKPHVVKVIGNGKGIDPRFKEKHYAGIDARFYEPVIDGMQDAVNQSWGTAIESRLPNIIMCGKTGTVQNSRGKNHSVFIGFAPRDNPKIAIAVIVENGGYGGAYAAPIASFMAEKYLTDSLSGRTIHGSTIQMYKDANLLPTFLSKPFRPKTKTDSLLNKTDSLKKAMPVKNKNTNNAFNKVADKPKNNAASK